MAYHKQGTSYRLYKNNYYEVNAKSSGINDKILNAFLSQLSIMEDKHNKLFIHIFILDVLKANDTNIIMTLFNAKLKKLFIGDIGYQWVREAVKGKKEHYHQVLILDGNKIRSFAKIYETMNISWQELGGNHIHIPENPQYNYKRGDYETLADIIYRASYLAKNATKGNKPKQTKNYGTSRIKPNAQPENPTKPSLLSKGKLL